MEMKTQTISIPDSLVWKMITDNPLYIIENLPEGVELERVYHEDNPSCINFVVSHNSFPEVDPYWSAPILNHPIKNHTHDTASLLRTIARLTKGQDGV